MYERIFGKYPQVKVLNYVLINPEKSYSKKEIAVGANISRVTLDSFINDLEELNILSKDGLTYYVNINSKVVKALIKTQITLAEFDFEVDIDNELEKIEKGEVSITKQEELKMDDDAIIISSDNLNTDIILTQYIDKGFNKGRINYG